MTEHDKKENYVVDVGRSLINYAQHIPMNRCFEVKSASRIKLRIPSCTELTAQDHKCDVLCFPSILLCPKK